MSDESLSAIQKRWSQHYVDESGFITAWMFVPNEILSDVLSGAITEIPIEKSIDDDLFKSAYSWMKAMMNEAGLKGGKPGINPWWCWLTIGDGYRKPVNTQVDSGQSALIELRLRPDQVLFSDFHMWHTVLNYWFNSDDEAQGDAFDAEMEAIGLSVVRQKPLPEPYHSKIVRSWRKIFCLDHVNWFTTAIDTKGIQGVFWSLSPEMIVGVVDPDIYVENDEEDPAT